ncbi:hypothetical protein DY000_02046298 [Brassica cretica]|uniref:Leucine-rich repeat-containing N-terminal plant-type domain-containing protein n=1 Tax=Brassica cretica TaxID=69181 RepID=A0ABQ7ESR4_BRACR|nr:hypothetical protein DY000_02046298 [Brassica cretica]
MYLPSSPRFVNLTCHPRELEALRDFINELDSKPDGWDVNSTGDCCEWEGITCSSSLHLNDPDKKTLRITKLKLVNKKIVRFSGEIPDVFDTLHELEYLMAKSNRFSGGIPKSLANSQSLILLNLGNNSLSGPLYLNCAVMTNLASLDLGTNKFNSSFPEYLPSCRHLHYVNLGRYHQGRAQGQKKNFNF